MVQKEFCERILLQRPGSTHQAAICICCAPAIHQPYFPGAILHSDELLGWNSLHYDRKQKEFLLGRYAAKRAGANLLGRDRLADIVIRNGVFSQPLIGSPAGNNVQVSLSHSGDWGAAIVFPEAHPMSIDIEEISGRSGEVLKDKLTAIEQQLLDEHFMGNKSTGYTWIWTVKEALSKVLKTGLTTPLHVLEISSVTRKDGDLIAQFSNFPQYKALTVTASYFVYTLVLPRRTDGYINGRTLAAVISGWTGRG